MYPRTTLSSIAPALGEPAAAATEVKNETDPRIDENALLDTLPRTALHKGKLLLQHFKRKNFQWSNNGELVVNGAPVQNSNMTDLVHYFTRHRQTAVPPNGAKEMAQLLQRTNVPMEAIVPDSFRVTKEEPFGLDLRLATLFGPEDIPDQHLTPGESPRARKRVSGQKPVKLGVNTRSPFKNLRLAQAKNGGVYSAVGKRKANKPDRFGDWQKWPSS